MNLKNSHPRLGVHPVVYLFAFIVLTGAMSAFAPGGVCAQELTPEMLRAASQQTGLSEAELRQRYAQQGGTAAADTVAKAEEPGRTELADIDDSRPWRDTNVQVQLPMDPAQDDSTGLDDLEDDFAAEEGFFGEEFFALDAGMFTPPSFGPVPGDYRLGVGDEIIINVWGGVDLQLTRVVDRDGAVLLPQVGKIVCVGRTLAEVDDAVRERLAITHASIGLDDRDPREGADTFVEVTLGHLRGIRVFVVGEAMRPGSYELSSVSTVLTALYMAGGPSTTGSFRSINLVRGNEVVATLDIYQYLTGGSRQGDARLREGDTVFINNRGPAVHISGGVRRPMHYEMLAGETMADLVGYAGGFLPTAAPEVIHVNRILPVGARQSGQPDHILLDVPFDPSTGLTVDGQPMNLLDGDVILVDDIGDRLEGWVEIVGSVKRPGRYQFTDGMTSLDLVTAAGGLWPDALTERAVIDRTSPDGAYSSLSVPLADTEAGVPLQSQDVLEVFSRWEIQTRPQVHITGEVFTGMTLDYREGMTLRDLVLKAGGLKASADLLRAEISRTRLDAVTSQDRNVRPTQTVEIIAVPLGDDFLTRDESLLLAPYDRVAIRRLPWWEMQHTITITGEVFYPGVFSLERRDETLSSLVRRAGGLRPDAYPIGARVIRTQDNVGNIAIDLAKALDEPGSQYDVVLQDGDTLLIPDRMFTVKVVGEVGFPTSLVWEDGLKIDDYVNRAGGYLEKSDKGKSRVVYPNGMSLPNKGGSKVVAGSTIIVPIEPPPTGKTTTETIRDITGIVASLAMVWLVIDTAAR
ncbi:hypothetical protein DRQ50_11685 [bacterium]|nr:MAG: hypothetical protein DRQ50_11685 [bacterium]